MKQTIDLQTPASSTVKKVTINENDNLPNSVRIGLTAFSKVIAKKGTLATANNALALGIASFLQVGKQTALPDNIITECGKYIANLVIAGQVVPFTVDEILYQQSYLSST